MSTLPSSETIPGVFQFVDLQRTGGLADLPVTLCVIAHRTSTAATTWDNQAVLITSRSASQSRYGSGSLLDLMVKSALSTGPIVREQRPIGGTPKVYAIAVPPPAGGGDVQAEYTATFTGTPSTQGTVTAYVGEQVFTVASLTTDTATTLAARMKDAIDLGEPDSYLTAGVAAGVITHTARDNGVHGNDVLVHYDTSNAPGVSVAVAQSVVGVGVCDLDAALTASLTERFSAIVVAQHDATTLTDVAAHTTLAWQYDTDRPRRVFVGHQGDWSDAETTAATLDSYRIAVVSAEKVAGGGGAPFDFALSSRSMAGQAAAAVASLMLSQGRPNYNYNLAKVPAFGKPGWSRASLNDAVTAGVLVLAVIDGETVIVAPVSTAITDQTGQTTAPDRRWARFEIAATIRALREQLGPVLERYTQADQTPETLARAKTSTLEVLRAAAADQWVAPVTDASVNTAFETSGARVDLIDNLDYTVLTGVGAVVVTHNVSR